PLLDWWEFAPGGYPGSHYAVYPPALVEPLIKAMAPPKVCRTCGEPSRRITETTNAVGRAVNHSAHRPDMANRLANGEAMADRKRDAPEVSEKVTLGWSDCGHDDWRPAVILDPFVGSGTTLAVATGHGHDAIGIDLDERNYHLALERVGPMLLGPPERVEGHLRWPPPSTPTSCPPGVTTQPASAWTPPCSSRRPAGTAPKKPKPSARAVLSAPSASTTPSP